MIKMVLIQRFLKAIKSVESRPISGLFFKWTLEEFICVLMWKKVIRSMFLYLMLYVRSFAIVLVHVNLRFPT